MAQPSTHHVPVLLMELMKILRSNLPANSMVLDATFGAGGYSRGFLDAGFRVRAIDRDPLVAKMATGIIADSESFNFTISRFSRLMETTIEYFKLPLPAYDACVFDIGVSSMQLDSAARGFSFSREGPLDMRMNPMDTTTAADLINWKSEEQLAQIFYNVHFIMTFLVIHSLAKN
jgi:16S rRNA (cytosine1402-N4)-methyltransferase